MKEKTVEQSLRLLYALQLVDTQLQELQELKGDLPATVAQLESRVGELSSKRTSLTDLIKQWKIERDNADVEIIDLLEKIEKYKAQQLEVKSNKQYDALTREIESSETRTTKLQKEMELLEARMTQAKSDIDALAAELEEAKVQLEERQEELREVNKEHEQEERRLQHEREKLVVRVDSGDLHRYERIKNARGGTAIVPIKRNACGGCYSRVPPQKVLEIRQNAQIFACEHCGRILVSDRIVESSVAVH
jgi:predicted  nucleic acid-binding Zn-ribbon protein